MAARPTFGHVRAQPDTQSSRRHGGENGVRGADSGGGTTQRQPADRGVRLRLWQETVEPKRFVRMTANTSKVTIHMVTSLDGFIAKKDNDVSWMEASWGIYDKGVGMTPDVMDTIDCYIMGSRTYELALELGWPNGDTQTIVVTNRERSSTRDSVEFYSGDLIALVKELGQKNAWLVGGPTLYQEFLRLSMVDSICLTIVPILLGDGFPLFSGGEQKLRLKDMTAFNNGMIDLWYEVARSSETED